MHYHKTGHDLSLAIASAFTNWCDLYFFKPAKRISVFDDTFSALTDESSLGDADIAVVVPGVFAFNWTDAFQHSNHKFRIVHFIRDPWNMVMSGHLYHSQDPPPKLEHWMLWEDFSFCRHDPAILQSVTNIFGKFTGNMTKVTGWMNAAKEDCEKLLSKYKVKDNENYYQILRNVLSPAKPVAVSKSKSSSKSTTKISFSGALAKIGFLKNNTSTSTNTTVEVISRAVYDAVKIEAYRALFGGFSTLGDILSMTANILHQSPHTTKSFQLEEFAIGNEEYFRRTAHRMFSFLYDSISFESNLGKTTVDRKISSGYSIENSIFDKSDDEDNDSKNRKESSKLSCPLCHCSTIEQAVNISVRASFVDVSNSKRGHVTQNLMSRELRAQYINVLRQDPSLGELFHFLASIVQHHAGNYSHYHDQVGHL